jgi:hypothetical protein
MTADARVLWGDDEGRRGDLGLVSLDRVYRSRDRGLCRCGTRDEELLHFFSCTIAAMKIIAL